MTSLQKKKLVIEHLCHQYEHDCVRIQEIRNRHSCYAAWKISEKFLADADSI